MDPSYGIFWSYAHHDNEHDQGHILYLADLLEDELRSQGVRNFPIWRDRVHIEWGDDWPKTIMQGVHGAVFFMPVVSPAWYESRICMEEIDAFIRNEHLIGDGRCILPINYIDTSKLDPPLGDEFPDVKPLIDSRQWQCWREHRFSNLDDLESRRLIAGMAISIRDRLEEIRRLKMPATFKMATPAPSEASDSLVVRLADGLDQLRDRLKTYSGNSNALLRNDATRLDRITGMVRGLLDMVQPADEGDVIRGDTLEAIHELQEELRICFDGEHGKEARRLIEFDDHDPVRRAIAALLALQNPAESNLSKFDNAIENALKSLIAALDAELEKSVAHPVPLELLRLSCQRWLDLQRVEFDVLDRRMRGLEAFGLKGSTETVFELSAVLMGKALDRANRIAGAVFADQSTCGEIGPLMMVVPNYEIYKGYPSADSELFAISLKYYAVIDGVNRSEPEFVLATPVYLYAIDGIFNTVNRDVTKFNEKFQGSYGLTTKEQGFHLMMTPKEFLDRLNPSLTVDEFSANLLSKIEGKGEIFEFLIAVVDHKRHEIESLKYNYGLRPKIMKHVDPNTLHFLFADHYKVCMKSNLLKILNELESASAKYFRPLFEYGYGRQEAFCLATAVKNLLERHYAPSPDRSRPALSPPRPSCD